MGALIELIKLMIQLITRGKTIAFGLLIFLLAILVYNFTLGIQEATFTQSIIFDANRAGWVGNFVAKAIPSIVVVTVPLWVLLVAALLFVGAFLYKYWPGFVKKQKIKSGIQTRGHLAWKIAQPIALVVTTCLLTGWLYYLRLFVQTVFLPFIIGFFGSLVFLLLLVYTGNLITPLVEFSPFGEKFNINKWKKVTLGIASVCVFITAIYLAKIEGFKEGTWMVCNSPQIVSEHQSDTRFTERSFLLHKEENYYVTFTQTVSKTLPSSIPSRLRWLANSRLVGRGCSPASITILPAADMGTVTLVYDEQVKPGECCYQLFGSILTPTPSATPDP